MEQSQSLVPHSILNRVTGRSKTDAVVELETAVAQFQARLQDDERIRLQSLKTTPHDIQGVIVFTAELDRSDPTRRGKSVATRLSSFLQTIQQFFPAIDAFVSSNPELAALIWGSVRLTFLILSNFLSYFESFVELLHGFSGLYSRFSEYQTLFKTSTELRDSICRFNTAIITSCEKIVALAHRPKMSQIAKALTSSFQSEMRPYIDAVKEKAEDVQRDIELVKAKTDRHEQKVQKREREEASENRSLVVSSLSKNWKQLSKVRKDFRKASTGRKQRQSLDGLSNYNRYITNLNSARNKRHLQTAFWIFETQEFKDWYALKDAPVLHITGKIGSGKTILSSRVIEFINDKQSESEVVSFFFSRFDDFASLDCDTILRSLVSQLVSRPSLTKIIERENLYNDLELARDQCYSRESLKKLFQRSIGLIEKWFIVLDGIDECNAEERRGLFEFLSDLVAHKDTSGKVKLLLSCRETLNHDIRKWFPSPLHVVTGSTKTSQDILTYAEDILRAKLSKGELVLGDIDLAEEILQSISIKEQGMFLWVFLSIEDICSRKSDADIAQALETLPSELNVTLDRALERISRHNNAEIAKAIFRWTAVVREPLKIDQLREALSIKIGAKVIDPQSQINGIERLTQWCENLVRIEEEDDTVRFSHHSILNYLSQMDSGLWKEFHIDYQQSDHHVGQVCLTYLNLKSPSTALQRARHGSSNDPFQPPTINFPMTAIARQAMKEVATSGVGARAGKLMDGAIQLREMAHSSRFSNTQAVIDVEYPLTSHFPFLQYADTYWQSHIRFLTSESQCFPLLVGMVEGSLLAHKMPWMDKKWRSSTAKEVISLYEFDFDRQASPFYAVIYANTIGSHDLLCQATAIIEQQNVTDDELTVPWLSFLVEEGHLECPRNCVAEAQKHAGHDYVINCITQYIADGIPEWPALVRSPGTSCECSTYFKKSGIYEDLRFVLVDGYRRSSHPLLQIFSGAFWGSLTKEGLEMLSQEFNLTELDLLRARTISGKSILDCQAEKAECLKPGYDSHKPHQLLLDILDREDVVAHAQEIGFGLDELRDLLTNGLRWAYRKTNDEMGKHLSKIVQNLTLSETDRITFNVCIFDIAEQTIREKTKRQIMEFVAEASVIFYLQSANRLARFPEESVCVSFEQALKATNWILAKTLADKLPRLLANTISNQRAGILFAILTCRRCKVKEDHSVSISNWRLTLCQPHREQARESSRSGVKAVEDCESEYIDLLKRLGTEGSLVSYLDYS
ncbi:hypothetical protein FVEN_g795 [Fusarium venenatum]|uniref:NACHT domain-containing protein n=1 Tax=Fusarium venenatum TaxID=56646 RepID=A0A2L2TVH7_9HYPO|nr:uncharacterized protein FVRRES_10798 [Fusarium venenatum]KAG8361533.1 hypothetical protein FVEN_g795 [Fusarium venenatum]KAH6967375.1 hypothetical protein EDB82DRAFT_518425 [Fusarium venenatum]CEI70721.1 unnamed protein product [Fusarium venenatum]